MREMMAKARLIIMVSHDLGSLARFCQRAIWLDHGRVRLEGPTPEVVKGYLDAVDDELVADAGEQLTPSEDEPVVVEDVSIHGADGHPRTDFEHGERLLVRLRCLARRDVRGLACTVTVRGDYGPLFSADFSTEEGRPIDWTRGRYLLECAFDDLPLLPGVYRIEVQVRHGQAGRWAAPQPVAAFRIGTDLAAFGSRSVVGATKSRGGFLAVPYHWRLESAAGARELPGLTLPVPPASAH
jgi:hypothetical protein